MKTILKITFGVVVLLILWQYGYNPTCNGIDVSHYNDIDRLSADIVADLQFIIAKATEGSTLVDRKYKKHRAFAVSKNIKFGAYHFLTKQSPVSEQFEHFKNTVGKDIDIVPCVDIEKVNNKHWGMKEARKAIKEWSELCKEYYGKYPIIYCNDFYRIAYFYDMPNQFWITNWHFRPLTKCAIHQFSNNNETLDYNYLNININEICL